MIPKDKMKPGYLIFWKVTKKSGLASKLVGALSKKIPNCNDKYSHVGMVDRHTGFIIHARPPRVIQEPMTPEFWERNKKCDLELWRVKNGDDNLIIDGELMLRREHAVNFYWKHNFPKERYNSKGLRVGRGYDFKAIFTFALGENRRRSHCAESVYNAYRSAAVVLNTMGIFDRVVSPQEILASGKLERVC